MIYENNRWECNAINLKLPVKTIAFKSKKLTGAFYENVDIFKVKCLLTNLQM